MLVALSCYGKEAKIIRSLQGSDMHHAPETEIMLGHAMCLNFIQRSCACALMTQPVVLVDEQAAQLIQESQSTRPGRRERELPAEQPGKL